MLIQAGDPVVAGVEGAEAEALDQLVVVAELLDVVGLQLQLLQLLREEGHVEPLQTQSWVKI